METLEWGLKSSRVGLVFGVGSSWGWYSLQTPAVRWMWAGDKKRAGRLCWGKQTDGVGRCEREAGWRPYMEGTKYTGPPL
ncbi:hypothetical protein GGTG_14262 [Gaeumannomyces tritici R3-111a-1]|uniref:Uncharacterized protein n=1 Tax=Gaeumannomyces tritici (strain R3-111a-1) TaxID=644352 RepID=J3PL23_GAET3|nr:hypothetical protein GGTG_14262 [Gaeumannomyces tritici R3-111a-1]EJT68158.1 hypothetical protein GGTG_14262 [Gaeumannomyces tritici R3-111a-1]